MQILVLFLGAFLGPTECTSIDVHSCQFLVYEAMKSTITYQFLKKDWQNSFSFPFGLTVLEGYFLVKTKKMLLFYLLLCIYRMYINTNEYNLFFFGFFGFFFDLEVQKYSFASFSITKLKRILCCFPAGFLSYFLFLCCICFCFPPSSGSFYLQSYSYSMAQAEFMNLMGLHDFSSE